MQSPYDHVDLRVRNLAEAIRLYDAIMPQLGLAEISHSDESASYYPQGSENTFLWIVQESTHSPGATRVAFRAESREAVDNIAAAARRAGAQNIEGPELCTDYGPSYYAVFFEDGDGNKLEICHRG